LCVERLRNAKNAETCRADKAEIETNFNDKEAASIYYGIMAVAHKMELSLGTKEGITSAVNNFLSGELSSYVRYEEETWLSNETTCRRLSSYV